MEPAENKRLEESVFKTPIGCLRLITEGDRVLRLAPAAEAEIVDPATSFQREVIRQLNEYFEGRRRDFSFKLELEGSDFQKSVWNQAQRILFGQKKTYGEIAKALGKPQAARAVGRAMGQNPVLIFVPCHRVVAFGGKLGGFSCGIENKKALLSLETQT